MHKISTTRDCDEFIAKVHDCAPHWLGILRMCRDYGLALMQIPQDDKSAFWRPEGYVRGRPWLVCLADDLASSKGPSAFNRASVRRLLRECSYFVVNASDEHPLPYDIGGTMAVFQGRLTVLVECQPSTQDAWISLARRCGLSYGQMLIIAATGHMPSAPGIKLGRLPEMPQPIVH